jgi:outer membrane lipoprotein-sorting protein
MRHPFLFLPVTLLATVFLPGVAFAQAKGKPAAKPTAPPSDNGRGAQLFAQMVNAVGQTRSLQVQVTLTRRSGGEDNTRTGRALLARPNLARIEWTGSEAHSLVATGRAVFLSNARAFQVASTPTGKVSADGNAIGSASGAPLVTFFYKPDITSLAPGYEGFSKPRYVKQANIAGVGCDIVEITGTKPTACTLTLAIGSDRLPRRMTFRYQVTPRFAEVIEVTFANPVVGAKVAPNTFAFSPVRGAVNLTPHLVAPADAKATVKPKADPGTVAPDGTIVQP